jgi:ubiquitin-conjugating enzyme E2 Q
VDHVVSRLQRIFFLFAAAAHWNAFSRYLLIKGLEAPAVDAAAKSKKKNAIPLVKLDPAQTITLMSKALQVPQPGYQIAELVQQREQELVDEEYDEADAFIFEEKKAPPPAEVIDISDDEPMPAPPPPSKGKSKGSSFVAVVSSALKGKGNAVASGSGSSAPAKGPPKDDWKHNADYVRRTLELLMPPPLESSPSATMAVQRELKTMLKEQDKAMVSSGGLKELGWYMPQEFMGDNLFQWIVEMHSFDETLPIAKDLKRE